MNNVAHFSIISLEEFTEIFENKTTLNSSKTKWSKEEIKKLYDSIEIPKKQGPYYIFKNLHQFKLTPNDYKVVPLGIRVEIIDDSYILKVDEYRVPNAPYKDVKISAFTNVPFFTSDYEGNLYLLLKNNLNKDYFYETNEEIAIGYFVETAGTFESSI